MTKNEIADMVCRNQGLLDLTVRLGIENKLLKQGMTEMAEAAYHAVFEACRYGEIGSNGDWFNAYAAYGEVGKVYGKFIPQTPADKDSMLWGNQKI